MSPLALDVALARSAMKERTRRCRVSIVPPGLVLSDCMGASRHSATPAMAGALRTGLSTIAPAALGATRLRTPANVIIHRAAERGAVFQARSESDPVFYAELHESGDSTVFSAGKWTHLRQTR